MPKGPVRKPSQLYVAVAVALTGLPATPEPVGRQKLIATAELTELPPFLSSPVSASFLTWHEMALDFVVQGDASAGSGVWLTAAQRAAALARCVSSIQ